MFELVQIATSRKVPVRVVAEPIIIFKKDKHWLLKRSEIVVIIVSLNLVIIIISYLQIIGFVPMYRSWVFLLLWPVCSRCRRRFKCSRSLGCGMFVQKTHAVRIPFISYHIMYVCMYV